MREGARCDRAGSRLPHTRPMENTMKLRSLLAVGALLAMAGGAAWSEEGKIVSFGTPVAGKTLSTARGGTDTTVNDMRLRGTTANNAATNVQTGMNTITQGSFANMSGIPMVIQNTGANVLIQSAVILNLQLQ